MPRYSVSVMYDANAYVVVDAANPEEAKQKAIEAAPHVSLCNYCSKDIEVNDPYDTGDPEEVDPSEPLTEDAE